MKLIPVISRRPGGRRARRLPPLTTVTASLALLIPLSLAAPGRPALASPALASPALASPALASTATAGQAASPSCPWLNRSLPIPQRVALLLSKMTLANEITMVEGQGTGQPYVFYLSLIHI